MAERITLTTLDDVRIVGDWSPASTMIGAAILLHMMPATRASWTGFTRALNARGIGSFAIDLRGHGDSTELVNGTRIDYRDFNDEQQQSSIFDVAAAVDWVRSRDLELKQIALGGASIGASLALRELGEEPQLAGAFLMSPGDYHGFKTAEDMEKLLPSQQLLIVSSEDDVESYSVSKRLYDDAPVTIKTMLPYTNAGHGTAIFNADAKLADKAAKWMADALKTT